MGTYCRTLYTGTEQMRKKKKRFYIIMRSSSSWVRQHGLHMNTHLSTVVNFGSSAREKHRLEKRYLPSSASVERYAIAESHFLLLVNMIYEPMLSGMDRSERETVWTKARRRGRTMRVLQHERPAGQLRSCTCAFVHRHFV